MANDGPDTNGSQFFITLSEVKRLNYMHSVFGRVIHGLEVLPKVEQGDSMQVKILRIGAEANAFRANQEAFDKLAATKPRAIPPHFDDVDCLLPTDPPRAKGFDQGNRSKNGKTGQVKMAALRDRFSRPVPDSERDLSPIHNFQETLCWFFRSLSSSSPIFGARIRFGGRSKTKEIEYEDEYD
jgi:hypothetical protein